MKANMTEIDKLLGCFFFVVNVIFACDRFSEEDYFPAIANGALSVVILWILLTW